MKKIFYCAAMAIAVVLVGCNPPVEDNKYTSISLKPNELTLVAGDTTQVSLLYQPASAAHPDATWASSDTNVVKIIGKGIVVAKDTIGNATITAKVDNLTATCEVKVDIVQNLTGFNDILYFPDTKEPIGSVKDTTLASGNTYKIQLYKFTYFLPSTYGFDSETLMGEGFAIFADAVAYFINDASSKYNGQMFSDRGFELRTDSLENEYAALAGSYDADKLVACLMDSTLDEAAFWAAYEDALPGAYLTQATVTEEVSYLYMHYGAVTDGYIYYEWDEEGNYAGTVYDLYIDWYNDIDYWLGLAIDWEKTMAAQEWIFVEPYKMDVTRYHYTSSGNPVQLAPAFMRPVNGFKNPRYNKVVNMGKPEKLQVMPRTVKR